jgi:hypothetical protein
MKCAQHYELDAVGTCNDCGKGLCPECVSTFSPPVCESCATAHNRGVATSLWTQLVLMAGLFVVAMIILVGKVALLSAIGYSLMAAFFLPGWNFLGRYFTPGGGYFFASARWMNLGVHTVVAAFLGVVVGPIYLFKAWKDLKTVRETSNLVGRQ